MIADWLRAPDVWVLAPLASALSCALLLTLTRRRLSPENPTWRVWRAILICSAMSVWPFVQQVTIRRFGTDHLFAFQEGFERGTLKLVAVFLGGGVLLGWLIPWLIEGRSLAAMGWVRRRAGWFLLGGLLLGLAFATLVAPRNAFGELGEELGLITEYGLGLLALLPASYLVSCALYGLLAGWAEENIFRGHLMLALVERGCSPRRANVLQAVAFALYHMPARVAQATWHGAHTTVRGMAQDVVTYLLAFVIAYFLWGLAFGLLRFRTCSIVPGFALHAGYDALWIMLAWGPMAVMLADLAG